MCRRHMLSLHVISLPRHASERDNKGHRWSAWLKNFKDEPNALRWHLGRPCAFVEDESRTIECRAADRDNEFSELIRQTYFVVVALCFPSDAPCLPYRRVVRP